MKPNELDDFLKKKEAAFEVPFEEAYWKRAEALLDRERTPETIFWTMRNTALVAAFLLMTGAAVWYFGYNHRASNSSAVPAVTISNHTATGNNSSTTDTHTGVVPASVKTPTNSDNADVINASNATTSSADNVNHNIVSSGTSNNVSTARHLSVANHDAHASRNNANVNATNSNRINATNNSSTPNNNSIVSNRTLINAGATNIIVELSPVASDRAFITYHEASQIPVFEDMTPDDATLLKFYGLYYDKSPASHSRKIREFAYGAQYPLLALSAVAGINAFNQIKNPNDTNVYIGINPYVGVKACYQWNPKWSVSMQPMLAQRGGVHLAGVRASLTANDETLAYRHLYYLQVPVTANWQMTKRNNVSVGGGVAVLLTSGTRLQNTEGKYISSYKLSGTGDDFRRMDYFVTAGYQLRMNKAFALQAFFKYGLCDMTKAAYVDGNKSQHNMQAGVGLVYTFYQEKIHW